MLGITDIELKQTRFYQGVHAEGQQLAEARILRQLPTRRFGPLPDRAERRLQNAPLADLECWSERVLDADSLEPSCPGHPAHEPMQHRMAGNRFNYRRPCQAGRRTQAR